MILYLQDFGVKTKACFSPSKGNIISQHGLLGKVQWQGFFPPTLTSRNLGNVTRTEFTSEQLHTLRIAPENLNQPKANRLGNRYWKTSRTTTLVACWFSLFKPTRVPRIL